MNPAANERLTATIGVLVVAPVIVEVASVLLGVHTFMSLHVFVGLALIPPLLLKLASTGWRFARYYTRRCSSRRRWFCSAAASQWASCTDTPFRSSADSTAPRL